MSGKNDNKEFKRLKLSTISFFVRFGAYFFLEEGWRVEGPTLYGKHHATDGAASAKLNLFRLCRVATEEGEANFVEDERSLVHVT